MPERKVQHFVPKFYLRRFSKTGKSVAAFIIASSKSVPDASIAAQCQLDYTYGRDGGIEDWLGKLESIVAPILDGLVKTAQFPPVFSEENLFLLLFLAVQSARTPVAAAEIRRLVDMCVRETLRERPDTPTELRQRLDDFEFIDSNASATYARALQAAATQAPTLLDLQRCLVRNTTGLEFVTSDAPVTFHNSWCRDVLDGSGLGFASQGLQVFLPLGPRHGLLLFDPMVYAFRCKQRPTVVAIDDARDVAALNTLQFHSAEHTIYYSGCSRTLDSVRSNDRSRRVAPSNRLEVTHVDFGSSAQMVRWQRRRAVHAELRFLRVLKRARSTPVATRPRFPRAMAEETMRALEQTSHAWPPGHPLAQLHEWRRARNPQR